MKPRHEKADLGSKATEVGYALDFPKPGCGSHSVGSAPRRRGG